MISKLLYYTTSRYSRVKYMWKSMLFLRAGKKWKKSLRVPKKMPRGFTAGASSYYSWIIPS